MELKFIGFLMLCYCVGVGIWHAYMSIARTDDYLRIKQAHEETKRRKHAMISTAAKASFGMARYFLKK